MKSFKQAMKIDESSVQALMGLLSLFLFYLISRHFSTSASQLGVSTFH